MSIASTAPDRGKSRLFTTAWPALVLVLVLAAPWLGNHFFLDDWHVLHMADKAEWTPEGLASGFTILDPSSIETWNLSAEESDSEAARFFRPLIVASYKLDIWLWGAQPVPSHAVNLLLHLIAVLLVAALALRVTGDVVTSRLVAVLFAIQPQNAVAVLWTSGRTELLVAVWMLGGILLHVIARQERRPWLYVGVAAAGVMACLSKESCVVMPACIAAYELSRLSNEEGALGRRLLRAALYTLPAASVVACYLVYRFGVFDAGGALVEPYLYSPTEAAFIGRVFAKTAYNLVALPTTVFIVPLLVVDWLLAHPAALVALVVSTIAIYALALRRLWRQPLVILGSVWLVASLLPTISILTVELYLYFPSIGFAFLAAAFFRSKVWKGHSEGGSSSLGRAGKVLLIGYLALFVVGFLGRATLYRVEGQLNEQVFEEISSDGQGELLPGTRLLLINMPIAASHLAPMARLRTGHQDIRTVLINVSSEWAIPTARARVDCVGPNHVRVRPPEGTEAFFETQMEWNLQLLRISLESNRSYSIDGLTVTPEWDDGRVVALDVLLERSLELGLERFYSFFEDGGRIAHRVCGTSDVQ